MKLNPSRRSNRAYPAIWQEPDELHYQGPPQNLGILVLDESTPVPGPSRHRQNEAASSPARPPAGASASPRRSSTIPTVVSTGGQSAYRLSLISRLLQQRSSRSPANGARDAFLQASVGAGTPPSASPVPPRPAGQELEQFLRSLQTDPDLSELLPNLQHRRIRTVEALRNSVRHLKQETPGDNGLLQHARARDHRGGAPDPWGHEVRSTPARHVGSRAVPEGREPCLDPVVRLVVFCLSLSLIPLKGKAGSQEEVRAKFNSCSSGGRASGAASPVPFTSARCFASRLSATRTSQLRKDNMPARASRAGLQASKPYTENAGSEWPWWDGGRLFELCMARAACLSARLVTIVLL